MAPVMLWLETIRDPLLQLVIVDSSPVQWMEFSPGTPGFGDIHETGRAPKKKEFISNANPIDACIPYLVNPAVLQVMLASVSVQLVS